MEPERVRWFLTRESGRLPDCRVGGNEKCFFSGELVERRSYVVVMNRQYRVGGDRMVRVAPLSRKHLGNVLEVVSNMRGGGARECRRRTFSISGIYGSTLRLERCICVECMFEESARRVTGLTSGDDVLERGYGDISEAGFAMVHFERKFPNGEESWWSGVTDAGDVGMSDLEAADRWLKCECRSPF